MSCARGKVCGQQRDQRLDACHCERQPEGAADGGDEETFGEELPDDARTLRTERDAHGDLPLPRRCAREHEVGGVGAGDEQHHGDRGEQHQQQRPACADDVVVQRNDQHAPAHIAFVLARELRHDRVQLRLCLIQRDAVFQPPNAFQIMRAALRRIAPEGKWPPRIHILRRRPAADTRCRDERCRAA